MGADFYFYTTKFTRNPNDALKILHESLIAEYDIVEIAEKAVKSYQNALAQFPLDDEFSELRMMHSAQIERLQKILKEPIPTELGSKITLLQSFFDYEIGNLLDIQTVKEEIFEFALCAKSLSNLEILDAFGEAKLLSSNLNAYLESASNILMRGTCVCFPLYKFLEDELPNLWCFAGLTID